jgi:small-conductance mechanosensitive channel
MNKQDTLRNIKTSSIRSLIWLGGWFAVYGLAFVLERIFPDRLRLPSGYTAFHIAMYLSLVVAGMEVLGLITRYLFIFQGKPPGGGFAAWILILLKRPFRPGDRIQFPALNLTGDVQDIGAMYITLNQVGGSIASEEAVGRSILLPNAMLFQQVIINYTVIPDAPYMLDEVIIRITYDSNWARAEKILLNVAWEVTREIIETTGEYPYIRSELYDYGVYLRLRYQTRVQDRAEIAYKIEKRSLKRFNGIPRWISTSPMCIPIEPLWREKQM